MGIFMYLARSNPDESIATLQRMTKDYRSDVDYYLKKLSPLITPKQLQQFKKDHFVSPKPLRPAQVLPSLDPQPIKLHKYVRRNQNKHYLAKIKANENKSPLPNPYEVALSVDSSE